MQTTQEAATSSGCDIQHVSTKKRLFFFELEPILRFIEEKAPPQTVRANGAEGASVSTSKGS